MTTTTQLRRYEVAPGHMEDFLDWWPGAKAARESAGFRVVFAFADREGSEFVWGVAYDGDRQQFDAAVERYQQSPEKAKAFAVDPLPWLPVIETRFVDDVT